MSRSGPVTKDSSAIALGLAQIRIGNTAANIASATPVLAAGDSIGALANTKFISNVDWYTFKSGFPQLEDLVIPTGEACSLECAFNEITPFNLALANGIDPLAELDAAVVGGTVVSAAGTTTGVVSVTNAGGATTETFTVVFTGATTFSVYGSVSGHVGDGVNLTTAFEPDNGGHPYFDIPSNFFSGTWEADDTYTFSTTEYVVGSSAYGSAHSGSIGLGGRTSPDYIRMEAVYTYPNGSNHMTIIFPRSQVAASVEVDLQKEEAAAVPITFEAKRADSEVDGGNVAWDSAPLGKLVFD